MIVHAVDIPLFNALMIVESAVLVVDHILDTLLDQYLGLSKRSSSLGCLLVSVHGLLNRTVCFSVSDN